MPSSERTYPPSAARLRQARIRGEVARSRSLIAAVVVAAGAGTLAATGPGMAATAADIVADSFAIAGGDLTPALILDTLAGACSRAVLAAAPIVFIPAAAAVAVSILQTGPMLAPRAVAPSAHHFGLAGRLRAVLLTSAAPIQVLRTLVMLAIACGAFWFVSRPRLADLAEAALWPPSTAAALAWRLCLVLTAWIAGAAVVVGAIDLIHQVWLHRRALRMTRAEWLRDLRDEAGDPAHRAARRRTHRELAQAQRRSRPNHAS